MKSMPWKYWIRGNPTLQVEVLPGQRGGGKRLFHQGHPRREREALELRDGGRDSTGKGVLNAGE